MIVRMQAQCRPSPRYLQRVQQHELVDAELRAITVSWLMEAHRQYNFEHEATLHLAVTYLDRYLSKESLHPDLAQLLAVSVLWLAMKVVESKDEEIGKLLRDAGDDAALTVENVEQAEVRLVEALEFRLHVPTGKVRLTWYRIAPAWQYSSDICFAATDCHCTARGLRRRVHTSKERFNKMLLLFRSCKTSC